MYFVRFYYFTLDSLGAPNNIISGPDNPVLLTRCILHSLASLHVVSPHASLHRSCSHRRIPLSPHCLTCFIVAVSCVTLFIAPHPCVTLLRRLIVASHHMPLLSCCRRHVVASRHHVTSLCVASCCCVASSHCIVCRRCRAAVASRHHVGLRRCVVSLHLVVCRCCCAAVTSQRSCRRRHAGVASRSRFVAPHCHATSSCCRRVVALLRCRVVAPRCHSRHMPSSSCVRRVPSSRRPCLSCLVASVSCVTSSKGRHRHRLTVLGWLLRLSPLPLAVAVTCVVLRCLPPRVVSLPPCLRLACRVVASHRAHPSRGRVVAISRVALCPLAV